MASIVHQETCVYSAKVCVHVAKADLVLSLYVPRMMMCFHNSSLEGATKLKLVSFCSP